MISHMCQERMSFDDKINLINHDIDNHILKHTNKPIFVDKQSYKILATLDEFRDMIKSHDYCDAFRTIYNSILDDNYSFWSEHDKVVMVNHSNYD